MKGNIDEPHFFDQPDVFIVIHGTGHATGVHFSGVADGIGQFAPDHHIGNAEMAANFKYTAYLRNGHLFVGHQVQHTVADHHIGLFRGDRHVLDITVPELHVLIAQFFSVLPGQPNHLPGHIDADHLPLFSDQGPRHETVIAGARAQVDYGIAPVDLNKISRDTAAQAKIGIRVITLMAGIVFTKNGVRIITTAVATAS